MPIDTPIAELSKYSDGMAELSNIRAGERTKQSTQDARIKIDQLKKVRDKLDDAGGMKSLQERGIQLQIELEEALTHTPEEFLANIETYTDLYELSKEEAAILKSVAKESLKKKKSSRGVINRFIREAKKKLGKPADASELDADIELEVGKLIFKAKTGRYPVGYVTWMQSPLAVSILVTDDQDRARLINHKAGGFYEDKGRIGFLGLTTVPFIYISSEGFYTALQHEETHAENATISDALGTVSDKVKNLLYGRHMNDRQRERTVNQVEKLARHISKSNEDTNYVPKLESILKPNAWEDSLTRAKDELVADFFADSDFTHLENLLKHTFSGDGPQASTDEERKKGLQTYQYLEYSGMNERNFAVDPSTHDEVVDTYNAVLTENVQYLESVWNTFKKEPDAKMRKRKLIAFMRQNPVSFWKVNGQLVFETERKELASQQKTTEEEKKRIDGIKDNAARLRNQVLSLDINQAIIDIKKNGVEIPEISDFSAKIERLASEIDAYTNSETTQTNSADILLKSNEVLAQMQTEQASLIRRAKEKVRELEQLHPLVVISSQDEELREALSDRAVSEKITEIVGIIYNTILNSVRQESLTYDVKEKMYSILSSIIHTDSEEGIELFLANKLSKLWRNPDSSEARALTEEYTLTIKPYLPLLLEMRSLRVQSTETYYSEPELKSLISQINKSSHMILNNEAEHMRLTLLEQEYSTLEPKARQMIADLPSTIEHYQSLKSQQLGRLAAMKQIVATNSKDVAAA